MIEKSKYNYNQTGKAQQPSLYTKNRREIGAFYEEQAARYLESKGYRIISRNFYSRFGEIDIVAAEDGYLVFTEVKYRRTKAMGSAAEAVNYRKQRRLYKTAQYYIMKERIRADQPIRFDVVAIDGDTITLIKNAFGGM